MKWWFSRAKRRPSTDASTREEATAPSETPGTDTGPEAEPTPAASGAPATADAPASAHHPETPDAPVEQPGNDADVSAPSPDPAPEPLTRAERVEAALADWSHAITGGETGPSFLTQLRAGDHVLDLTHSHPSGLAQLLAGRGPTRLSSLVREVGALADARAHARAIRETAERQAEEIGLTTCHLGIGEAIWEPGEGQPTIHAPVLVRPITLRLRGNAREDVELDLDAAVDLNPVLLRALREAGVAVDARALLATTDSSYGFDPNPVLDAFRALGEALPGFRVTHALVVGNLIDAAGPLAADLATDTADWTQNTLVAALAGDAEAQQDLRSAPDGPTDPLLEEQSLVAAVQPDHSAALQRVLAGGHLAITSLPGVETDGLVVDLAAELMARGRSVLVVSQRRRTLGQIAGDVEERGLGDLLFDLSPDPALQRNASESLLMSLRRAGSYRSPVALEEPDELAEARSTLAGHVEAMHRTQRPWGVSAHDAISALAALTRLRPAPRTTVRLPADVAARMVEDERAGDAAALREAADAGVLTTGPDVTPWFGAGISTDIQAGRAEVLIDRVHDDLLPPVRDAAAATSAPLGLRDPRTVDALHERLDLLEEVRTILATFQPAVFSAPLDELIAATGDAQFRTSHQVTLTWGTRRRLRREAQALLHPAADETNLHRSLLGARRVRDAWNAQASEPGRTPSIPEGLTDYRDLAVRSRSALDELDVLLAGTPAGGDLSRADLDLVQERMAVLRAHRADLETLPRLTTLIRRLTFDGLGDLVADLRERRVPAAQVASELDLAWWRSVLEHIAAAEPTISSYDGTSLSQVAERFRRLDVAHLAGAAHRILETADDIRVETMKAHPDASRAAIAEISRSSTTSVRDLAAKYEEILFRARPAWIASPYLVPQVVPRGPHFDVVILADGGRLPTAAALPSIARARQTVVIGDPLEYAGDLGASVLDDMLRVAPRQAMRRDDQVAGTGVRSFAQRRAVQDGVLAVPGPTDREADLLAYVENARGVVSHGDAHVESTEQELRRVTDLVIEHARTRPERSLAVLTLTEGHARRVMERVMQTVAVIPQLRSFFDPESPEYFTVSPASLATGLQRDDIIVSVGFGKTPHGRLIHRFGPLSTVQGRKALASVLTRARGRTTVVTGLQAEDIDPSRLKTEGARDLLALLRWMNGGEDDEILAPVSDAATSDADGSDAQAANADDGLAD
ncbi:MAG: hypothetical protein Q4G40_01375, partial [Brachybacterium sp.]|nr:hypothetical protein [Brachybacterium sp.]